MATQKRSRKSNTLPVPVLVQVHGQQLFTTSLIVAEGCKLDHKEAIATVRKFKSDFEELSPLAFESRKGEALPQGGFAKSTEYAILNEDQATYLIMSFRNTPIVRQFKLALVKDFRRVKTELERIKFQQQEPIWQQQRLTGKTARLELTDGIKEFVEYAKAQGSQNAERYYQIITKMEYRALFLVEKAVGHGFRDTLTALQNANLTAAENIAQKALRDGMKEGMHYKAIFPIAKVRVEQFATLIQIQPALTRDDPQLTLAA